MKTITVSEAFSNAPPRSAAVLCVKGERGRTDMLLTDWFTWLNIKRNPMISFSLPRNAEIGARLRDGDALVLAFPLLEEAKQYQQMVSVEADVQESETIAAEGLSVRSPKGSEVLLRCTIAGAYNYPFKKVRIFNCNLEEALGNIDGAPD
ncbi:MAG: hypothetical protein IKQ41_04045 [Clostridia bacterium]|nr:hypothetical protein [Clostridia bacterium]